jgi:hypothetical protein
LVKEPGIKKNHANAGEGTTKLAATIKPHVKNLLLIFILSMTCSPKKPKKGHRSDGLNTVLRKIRT